MEKLTETQELIYDKVLKKILLIPCGDETKIDKNHAGYDNFVACCKFIMDNSEDWNRGFSLVFSSDYGKIRKDERFNFVKPATK